MAGESSVFEVLSGAAAGQKPTAKVLLVNAAGLSVRTATGILVGGTTYAFYGASTTRDTVRAEVGTCAIGSTYQSTAGKLYLKVANAGATADWQKVTATAAD